VANPLLPAAIASKSFVMEFAGLSSRQQTARPALFIERSPHPPLLQKATLIMPELLVFPESRENNLRMVK
jgi:hypothetical protein